LSEVQLILSRHATSVTLQQARALQTPRFQFRTISVLAYDRIPTFKIHSKDAGIVTLLIKDQ